jgi:biopolymer transport protein ExbB
MNGVNNVLTQVSWLSIGPMGWILVCLLGVAAVIFTERMLYLHRGHIRAIAFMAGIKNLVTRERIEEAITLCSETPGPVAKVVQAGLKAAGRSQSFAASQMQSAALLELPLLERRIGSLSMIARLGPLCGLMGTILSLLMGYFKMAQHGPYAHAALFAREVTQAILSTTLGLGVSIVAYIGYHILRGRVRSIVYDMEWAGTKLIQLLEDPEGAEEIAKDDDGGDR